MSLLIFQAKPSLTRTTLINMGLRIAVVIIAVTLLSYWHVISLLELETKKQLEKYIIERGQRENHLFALSTTYHNLFKQEFIARYQTLGETDTVADFNQLFTPMADGTTRIRPEYFYGFKLARGMTAKGTTGFISKQVNITAEIRKRMLIAYDLVSRYGTTWDKIFYDLYVSTPENMLVEYLPEVPWGLDMAADFDILKEEWYYVSDVVHNPQRQTTWTGLYYDVVSKQWMVSCITPIDIDGQHRLSLGNDILLNDLLQRTTDDHLEGTYNLMFRPDGRLIVHPTGMTEIQNHGGQFNILDSGDQHLFNVFEAVKNMKPGEVVIEDTEGNNYLAVTQLQGPQWYLVTVYPKQLLAKLALSTARFILSLGILSLLMEFLVLFLVLRKQVARPLQSFQTATERLANGDFSVQLDTSRQDELGRLAQAFNTMSTEIQVREHSLRDTERHLRQFLEAMPIGVFVITREAKPFYLNRMGQQILGISEVPDLITDLQLSEVFNFYVAGTSQRYPNDQLTVVRALRYGERTIRDDIEIHRHGDIIPIENQGTPIFDEAGNISHAMVVFHDITERKQAEADRLRLVQEQEAKQAALRYSQTIEAKNAELVRLNLEKEAANQKIMQSIQYAQVIQSSLLPDLEGVKTYLPNSFLIWQPRDIVGGDMLYIEPVADGVLIALLDCTGHGVPGAFMTMLVLTHLRHIVEEHGHQPSDLLKRLNVLVKTSLQQDTDHAHSDDGLDAAICLVQPQAQQLLFAGAKLPLYYRHHHQVKMIKGDKQNLGYKRSDVHFTFTTHTLPLEPGMTFYLATDGLIDQLGGPKRLPLGNKRFQALLLECRQDSVTDQAHHLLTAFQEYQGENARQDDVTVVGFMVK